MAGPFLGINMASQAMRGLQYALDTTGHNISNVNTRGYTRQAVDFGALPALNFYSQGWRSVGQGSFVSNINRVRADYLDRSLNNAASSHSKYASLSEGLSQIDAIYGEPSDTGVSGALNKFFDSWSGLAADPSNPATRAEVRLAGQNLADRVRNRYADVSTVKTNAQKSVTATIGQINALGEEIAGLNAQITNALATGGTPNDLMDRRDLALQELSTLTNISKEVYADGSYAVYASGFTLVQGSESRTFPSNTNAANGTVTDGTLTYSIRGGKLAGDLATVNEASTQMANLDSLANELRTQINTAHVGGINGLGNTGVRFFSDVAAPPQTGAVDFDLSAEVKADPAAISAGISGEPGDGGLAQLFAGYRETTVAALGGKSFGDYFQGVMTKLATDASYYSAAAETEAAIMTQVTNQQQAVSGVSVDDEMANLMKYQRSYQAAAKALVVFDQVSEDLIGMLRR